MDISKLLSIKLKKPMHTYTLIGIILIGIATVVGTYLIHKGNLEKGSEKNKELVGRLEEQKTTINNLNDSNTALRTAIDKLAGVNEKQLSELDILKKENSELRNELSETKSEVLNTIIGGDSYGLIVVNGLLCGNELCYQFSIGNMGNKPLYDVVLNINDPEEYSQTLRNGIATVEGAKLYKRINIGNLPPNLRTSIFEPMNFPEKGYFHYVSYIGTRNGIYYQEIFCYPSVAPNQGWRLATKLHKMNFETNKYELKYEYIDKSLENLNWELEMN